MSSLRSFLGDRRRLLISGFVIVALLIGAGAWYYYYQYLPAQTIDGEETIQTAKVRRGNLIVVAGGTGTLVPTAEVKLSFSSGGRLAEVLVEVGDQVLAGDVLARLDDTDAKEFMVRGRNDYIHFL